MRRHLTIALLLVLTIPVYSQSWKQKRFEVFGGVSVFQYFGDIGGTADKNNLFGLKDISLKACRPGINFGGTYKVQDGLYIQATNSLGLIAQTDKGSRNSARNFAFSSIIDEFSVQGLFFIIKEKKNYYYSIMGMRGGLQRVNRPISLYLFAGAGGLYFKTTAKNDLVGSPRFVGNKSLSLAIPVGLGLKFAYSPELSFGMELGARITQTDYLDGVTSPYSKHNDMYYLLSFKAIYRISNFKDVKKLFHK